MRTSVLLIYITSCLLSITIIGGALFTQYVWGEPFYDFIGALTIRGSELNATDAQLRTITRASAEYRGFLFNFDAPLTQMNDSGIVAQYAIRSYRKEERTFILYFEKGIVLHFHYPQSTQGDLLIRIEDREEHLGNDDAHYLVLEHRCPVSKCRVEERVVRIMQKDDAHYLYLPPHAEFDHKRIRISLNSPIRTLQFSNTYVPELLNELSARATDLLMRAPTPLPVLQEEFVQHAYRNWQERAYSIQQGGWKDREGNVRFSERIMIANLSEAIAQKEYVRTFGVMRRTYRQQKELTSILSLPYVGDTFSRVPAFAEREMANTQAIENIPHVDALLDDMRLLEYLYFRAPLENRQPLDTRIKERDYFSLDMHRLLNLLQYLLLAPHDNRDVIEEILMSRIVPLTIVNQDGVFITAAKDRIDFNVVIRAAVLMKRFASSFGYPALATLADAMRYSVMRLADGDSYIPQYALLTDDQITHVRGYIDPADVYPYLVMDREYSAYRALFARNARWLMSAMKMGPAEVQGERITIEALPSFTHFFYMVIGDSDRPRYVQIGDTQYGLNPKFEERIRGWYWFSDHRMLIIKFYPTDSSAKIVIQY